MNINLKLAAVVASGAAVLVSAPVQAASFTETFSFELPAGFTAANADGAEQVLGSITFDDAADTNGVAGIDPTLPVQQFVATDFEFSLFGETIDQSQALGGLATFVFRNGEPTGVAFINDAVAPFGDPSFPVLSLALLEDTFTAFTNDFVVAEGTISYPAETIDPPADVPEPAATAGLMLLSAAGWVLKKKH